MTNPIHSWSAEGGRFAVLVHGGAGQVLPDRRPLHVEGCRRAASTGIEVLRAGGSALDAVERAVRVLEDDSLFNAGTGACLNAEGLVEHDASIMEGKHLRAGGVCALRGFKEPISISRAALEDGRHVLYAAGGAERFARERGFVPVGDEALVTEAAKKALASYLEGRGPSGWAGGTVGAVAIDAWGLCASATSTGGMVGKRVGRVGDSPLIGAGTYADDEGGAVSTTGQGEGMIRLSMARMAVEAMRLGKAPEEAVRGQIDRMLVKLDMKAGAIAIDRNGRLGLSRSTETMSWAAAWEDGEAAGI